MLVDTHAHLDFPDFKDDVDEVLMRAKENRVEKIINVGATMEGSKKSVELAQKYEMIWATVGVHPEDIGTLKIDVLRGLLEGKKVVALGEVGLDFYRERREEEQRKGLLEQLALAKEFDKPVTLHVREAHREMIDILARFRGLRGVVHCFTADVETAKSYFGLGFLVSLTGIVTFGNTAVEEMIKAIPLDKIMVETDAPFLAPVPKRGKRNEPALVRYTAEKIAKIKKLDLAKVEKVTTENAEKLFMI